MSLIHEISEFLISKNNISDNECPCQQINEYQYNYTHNDNIYVIEIEKRNFVVIIFAYIYIQIMSLLLFMLIYNCIKFCIFSFTNKKK